MSAPILKLHVDERDNISVLVSQDVQVLTCEEADRIEAEYKRMQAENAKLRNEVDNLLDFEHLTSVAVAYAGCDECGEYKQTMLRLFADNAKLRELARGLHMAYVETLNECESLNEELIWECSGSIDDDIAKSRAKFEVLRHRFDDALCELGIEEDE